MTEAKYRVAIIGCGRMGQHYAEAYSAYPDTEIVAIAEHNPDRLQVVGERFGVKALYPDVDSLLRDVTPDVAAVITPTKFYKHAVIACAQAGVKGVSTDKPIAARLSDADEMIEACESRGIVHAGGNLMKCLDETQETAGRLRDGVYGEIIGGAIHGFRRQIVGGGCQSILLAQLLMDAEIEEVIAWGEPPEVLETNTDVGLSISGVFRMSNGLECNVYGMEVSRGYVDVWTEDTFIRGTNLPPEIYRGYDEKGARIRLEPDFQPYEWSQFGYLTGSIRSLLAAVDTGSTPRVTGRDLRKALEVAIAAKQSVILRNAPVKLPLEDRSLTLYPTPHRWGGYDAVGNPQPLADAAKPKFS